MIPKRILYCEQIGNEENVCLILTMFDTIAKKVQQKVIPTTPEAARIVLDVVLKIARVERATLAEKRKLN